MKTIRILAAFLAFTIIFTSYGLEAAAAAVNLPEQTAPNKLQIKAVYPNFEPPIGYSATDGGESGYYADIAWEGVPNSSIPYSQFVNIYLDEYPKGYSTAKQSVLREKDLPAGTTPIRMRDLKSGTVYKALAKAYYQYTTDEGSTTARKSPDSANSNSVKFLTDISLKCVTMGTNKFKVVWDDVWNDGKRISYKLYISENKDFANTLPIYITEDQISENGPIIVNKSTGTLEYVHNVSSPGRAYYVKVEPEIADTDIVKSPSSPTVIVTTNILVRTTKISTSEEGTIWRLEWSPVVTGITSGNIKVQYRIDKFTNGTGYPIMLEDGTSAFITIPEGQELSYYQIRAEITQNGVPFFPAGVQIVSDKVMLKESEIPNTPSMPEIVPNFTDSTGKVIISYEDVIGNNGQIIKKGELGENSATILWRAPKKGDGTIDKDVMYDIWLFRDPAQIENNSAPGARIESDFIPSPVNQVIDETSNNQIIGYKYKLNGLKPNTTYYFKIIAKKTFAEDVDGVIQNVEHPSSPALKVVTTFPGGAIDTPLIPSNPPLDIKKYNDGRKMITDNGVTIVTKNRWYEQFDNNDGKWKYVKTDKETLNDNVAYNPVTNPPDNLTHRKVQYDQGVSLYVGCEEFYEGIKISDIDNYKLEKISTVISTANGNEDPSEDPALNSPENIPDANTAPVYAKHNLVIPVSQLKPNTTYILWVRAARDVGNGEDPLFSDVSNPIIFTTLPTQGQIVEKPVVPTFTYSYAADSFVDLGWDYKDGNTYYIKYGTVDDPNKASNAITVTTSQIKTSGVNYVRIPGLTADTQYYFWIQAEAFSQDGTVSEKSEWSDSLPIRTLKDIPPTTPRGFGVKNSIDAVTKNSLTFEWIQEPGLEYILEVAGGVDYSDVKEYTAGAVSEFKVESLKSNFRYFARLYAYDPAKKLKSLPTQSVSVRTLRSSDDYDSDQDIDNVIGGDIVEKGSTVINGTWTVKIVGVNAQRLIEVIKTDKRLDYTVDVSKPPQAASYISIYISKSVFDKLEQLKENIAFKTSAVSYDLKAGILSNTTTENTNKEQVYLFSITLAPQMPMARANELLMKNPLGKLEVTLDTGLSNIPINRFATPLVVKYPYTNKSDYTEGKTYGYVYNPITGYWDKQITKNEYDSDNNKGFISINSGIPGTFGFADRTNLLYDDIYGYEYEDSIINVAFAHKLKSVEGRLFRPEDNITVGEAVKLAFDTIEGFNYDSSFMETAVKAGFIKNGKLSGDMLTRQDAALIAVALYERKAYTKAAESTAILKSFSDYSKIDNTILAKVAFAVQNGFVPKVSGSKFNPTQSVTRGEFMFMIEKALVLSGELE